MPSESHVFIHHSCSTGVAGPTLLNRLFVLLPLLFPIHLLFCVCVRVFILNVLTVCCCWWWWQGALHANNHSSFILFTRHVSTQWRYSNSTYQMTPRRNTHCSHRVISIFRVLSWMIRALDFLALRMVLVVLDSHFKLKHFIRVDWFAGTASITSRDRVTDWREWERR